MRTVEIKYFNGSKRSAVVKSFNEDELIKNHSMNVQDDDIVPTVKDKIYWCNVDGKSITAELKCKNIMGIVRWLNENK